MTLDIRNVGAAIVNNRVILVARYVSVVFLVKKLTTNLTRFADIGPSSGCTTQERTWLTTFTKVTLRTRVFMNIMVRSVVQVPYSVFHLSAI